MDKRKKGKQQEVIGKNKFPGRHPNEDLPKEEGILP